MTSRGNMRKISLVVPALLALALWGGCGGSVESTAGEGAEALGAAEAGFFPAMIIYLNNWFRAADRGKAVALFMSAISVAMVIGGPVSGALLRLDWLGLAGWRCRRRPASPGRAGWATCCGCTPTSPPA